jgi:hypothetical protein
MLLMRGQQRKPEGAPSACHTCEHVLTESCRVARKVVVALPPTYQTRVLPIANERLHKAGEVSGGTECRVAIAAIRP